MITLALSSGYVINFGEARNTTYCSTVCAGSGGQIRVEWDGSGFDLNGGLGVQASAVARIANCR